MIEITGCQGLGPLDLFLGLGQDLGTFFFALGFGDDLARFFFGILAGFLDQCLGFFFSLYRKLLSLVYRLIVDGLSLFFNFKYLLDALVVQLSSPVLPIKTLVQIKTCTRAAGFNRNKETAFVLLCKSPFCGDGCNFTCFRVKIQGRFLGM